MVSPKVIRELGATPEGANRVVTVENGLRAGVLGKLNDVLVDLGGSIFEMEFIVLDKLQFDVFIGRPTIARLEGVLDL